MDDRTELTQAETWEVEIVDEPEWERHRCPAHFALSGGTRLRCILANSHPNDHQVAFAWNEKGYRGL